MREQVLITGGAGHIGTRLVAAVVAEGLTPLVIDTRSHTSLLELAAEGKITLIQSDLADDLSERLGPMLRSVVSIVHLAALVDDTEDVLTYGIPSVEQNLLALVNLLDNTPSLRHICFPSSMMVYGDPVYSPMDEGHPTRPRNIYGTMKLTAEHYLRLYASRTGVAATILRLSGVYGPGVYSWLLRNRAIPNFIRRVSEGQPPIIYGDGSERRDYVFIDDAVRAIQLACIRRVRGVFNIGSGQGVSIRELARMIIRLFDIKMEPEIEGPVAASTTLNYTLDIAKAQRELNYCPQVSLQEGLAQEIAWFIEKKNN